MARTKSVDRLEKLIECGTNVFIAKGYKQTQMADVARSLGVAPGTLYLYVESKEALFDLLIRFPLMSDREKEGLRLPAPTPANGSTLEFIEDRLLKEVRFPDLEAALERKKSDAPGEELERIVRDMYDKVERWRDAIALLERSALDWPELAHVIYEEMRQSLILKLERYIESRVAAGQFRAVPDALAMSRLVLETISWFAMHRSMCCDPVTVRITDEKARETAVFTLVNAMVRPER